VFAADLVRFLFALGIDPQVEFVEVGSYGDRHERADMVEGQPLPAAALAGRTVLLLDDICDTGLTFATLAASARALGARRVLTCALIDKRERRAPGLARFRPDYTGFSVARGWVVGYGMDDGGRLRGSPEIAMLRPAAAAEPPALSAPAQPQG
jgi:hypoxanthine phosphoribosyltransferase